MKKIMLRRIEVMGHLPKEVRAAAITKLGSVYVNRQPLKGVEGEEAKKLTTLFEVIFLNLSQIFVSKHLSNLGI